MARATLKVVDPPQLESDYALLFDGLTKTDWQQSGPGEVRVEDGSLVTYGGLGMLWYAKQEYGDFSLKMSWKVEDGTDNAGVFIRFPNTGNVFQTAIDQGHEIQIHEGANTSEPQKTGSVYNFKREERRNSNPIGEWNDYEIRAKGLTIQVLLNGQVVNTYTGAAPRTKATGYFGLQNHDANSQVHYRYVRIKPLEVVAPSTTATLDPAQPGGSSGFYTGPVNVTLSATDDGSGVDVTEYRLDGGAWTRYSERRAGHRRRRPHARVPLDGPRRQRRGHQERGVRDRHRGAGHDRDARSGAAGRRSVPRAGDAHARRDRRRAGLRHRAHRALRQRRRVGALHGPARRSTGNSNYRVQYRSVDKAGHVEDGPRGAVRRRRPDHRRERRHAARCRRRCR